MDRVVPRVTAADELSALLSTEDRLIVTAAGYWGLKLRRAPTSTHADILALPPPRIRRITQSIQQILDIWMVCQQENVDPWDDTRFLSLSLRHLGLSFSRDFVDSLASGDLVEGYDLDRIQVFRNLRFMETSCYSLVEVQTYEWPMLYDRSSAITQRIISYSDDKLWANNRTIAMDIPEHFIREVRSDGRQLVSVQFRHMSPIFRGPGLPFGALVSCRAAIVSGRGDIDNLRFV